jgi:hypothetical protein
MLRSAKLTITLTLPFVVHSTRYTVHSTQYDTQYTVRGTQHTMYILFGKYNLLNKVHNAARCLVLQCRGVICRTRCVTNLHAASITDR